MVLTFALLDGRSHDRAGACGADALDDLTTSATARGSICELDMHVREKRNEH
jgi:hypothetical protein